MVPDEKPDDPRRLTGAATIAAAHAVNDSYAYILPALLPVLIQEGGITLGVAGLLVAVQQFGASFAQPLIGHLADRGGGGRWMAWVGVAMAGLAAAALGVAPGLPTLALAMLANGIGTALFHPVSAALVAQAAPPRARALWMSVYVSSGNFGLGLGPFLVAVVLQRTGLGGTWLLAFPALAAAFLVWRFAPARPGRRGGSGQSLAAVLRQHRRVLLTLISVVAMRSWASAAFVTFLPVFAASRGAALDEAAQSLTVFLVAGATGGLVGGAAADRLGRDRVVMGSFLLSVPFGLVLASQSTFGPVFWACATLTGFFLNGSWVPLTVRGQESVPGSIAMMSGLMLGLSIGLGGLAATPMGILAERVGLASILFVAALLPIAGAGLMLLVPPPPRRTIPAFS